MSYPDWPGAHECEEETTYRRTRTIGDGTHYHVESVDRSGSSPVVIGHWEVMES